MIEIPQIISKFDWTIIINGAFANALGGLLIFILGVVFLDKKKVLAPWIYKYFGVFGKTFVNGISFISKILINVTTRIIFALLIIIYININKQSSLLVPSALLSLISISFFPFKKEKVDFLPVGQVSDDFENLTNWEIQTGNPIIESDFGQPAPDLCLRKISTEATNSFAWLKNIESERGIIECDFYLEENSIFNIVFFADEINHNWYMARYDSRDKYSDGFIIKDRGLGANWKNFHLSGTKTSKKIWHRARVEFSSERVAMYKDGILIAEFNSPHLFGKKIGIFNEENIVHVDNFIYVKK